MKVHVRLNFGKILSDRGLTQKELSEMTGIRPAAISYLVRGFIGQITIDHLERIASALEITDANEFISFIEE